MTHNRQPRPRDGRQVGEDAAERDVAAFETDLRGRIDAAVDKHRNIAGVGQSPQRGPQFDAGPRDGKGASHSLRNSAPVTSAVASARTDSSMPNPTSQHKHARTARRTLSDVADARGKWESRWGIWRTRCMSVGAIRVELPKGEAKATGRKDQADRRAAIHPGCYHRGLFDSSPEVCVDRIA